MNISFVRKMIFAGSLVFFASCNAFSQSTDTTRVTALDTLNFEDISNESMNKPAPVTTPASPVTPEPVMTEPATAAPVTPSSPEPAPAAPVSGEPAIASPAVSETTSGTSPATPASEAAPFASDTSRTTGDTTQSAVSPASEVASAETSTEEIPSVRARQKTFTGYRKFKRLAVGINGGISQVGGFGISDYTKNNPAPGFGASVAYYLGRTVALQANFHFQTELNGEVFRDEFKYSPDIQKFKYAVNSMDYSLSALFNLGNINFTNKKNRVALFGSIGIGVVSYDSNLTSGDSSFVFAGEKRSVVMMPVGFGGKYRLTNEMTLNLGYTYKFIDSDGFDADYNNSNIDRFGYGYLGVTYMFGKKGNKSIEWDNPIVSLFDDLSGGAQTLQLRKKVVSLQEQMDSMEVRFRTKIDSLKMDTDGDGVLDFVDKEAETPKGAPVDAVGKALDSDGDGIIDLYDRCPFEKGTAAFSGCKKMPMKLSKQEAKAVKEAENKIFFLKNSAEVNEEAVKSLKDLADIMKKNPGYKLLISGYTDSDGDQSLNERLSLERATAVKRFLIREGIQENRLKAQGLGEKVYLDNNITSAGKRNNRVVTLEFVVY
jgi:OmpA-OmpF porin, OOP family